MTDRKRRSARSGRPPLLSPGRPPVAGRDERRRFWAAIASGMASEDAAVAAGVPQAIGTRWFRKAGGMPPAIFGRSAKPLSGRYLSLAEREELAILHAQGAGVREIARQMGRSASTISRELRRNAATRSGGLDYRATTAQWHADRAARRPKPVKLAVNVALRSVCAGSIGRRGRHAKGDCDYRAFGVLERSSTRTSAGSAMGIGMESGADCSSPTARLSPR